MESHLSTETELDLRSRAMSFIAIVHNDFDGTASAAVYSRAVGSLPKSVLFTEPTKLHLLLNSLKMEGVDRVMIADLGMNSSTFEKTLEGLRYLMGKGIRIEWFDHHVWREEWKDKLREMGIKVYHDTSTCGAGVIFKNLNPADEISAKLASADCSVDLWLHDNVMGEKLRRIIEYKRDFSWKIDLIQQFYRGELWSPAFDQILEDSLDRELKGFSRLNKHYRVVEVDGLKIAVAVRWKGLPDISYAAQYIMSRTGADVFASANGFSISFRSNLYDVRIYANELGGGGHPLAAGAGLRIPFWIRLLRRMGIKGPMLNYVVKVVLNTVKTAGVKKYNLK